MSEVAIEHAFQFCPRCAEKNDDIGSVPYRCAVCGFTAFFGPVAAVGALVTNDANELLLVRRAKDPKKGCWGLPGGFVDRFETAEAAVAREVREETSLEVTRWQFMMSHPNEYNYGGFVSAVIDFFFRCQVAQGDIVLADGELDEFQWVGPTSEHLDHLAFASNRVAIERWMRES